MAELTYGSFDEVRLRGVIDLPQMGAFSAKVSGQYRTRDGLIALTAPDGSGRNRTDSIESGSFMVQLRAEITDNITADYTYDYSKSNQTPPFSQLLAVNRNGDPRDIFDPGSPSYAFGGAFFPLDRVANPDRVTTADVAEAVQYRRVLQTGG